MKRINLSVKFLVFVLFLAGVFSSCLKSDDTSSTNTAATEAALIGSWKAKMKSEKIAYDSTASKIFYVLDKTKVGSGPKVVAENTVTVKYIGTFMDGAIFDPGKDNGFTYVHKSANSRMITGWEEAIELLNKGAKGTFLIPSSLAYGPYGYLDIPPYSPLFFVIEVVDIK